MVDELLHLWQGVDMVNSKNITLTVRAALLCVGCDIPAARKTCGFLGQKSLVMCLTTVTLMKQ